MLCLHALQLQPAPVQNLICEDGDQDGLKNGSAAVFVEVALGPVSHCSLPRKNSLSFVHEGYSSASRGLVSLGVGMWSSCEIGREARGARKER